MKRLIALFGLLPALLFAQSVPNGTITQGQTWSPAEWNTAWEEKLDYLPQAPFSFSCNPTSGIALPVNCTVGSNLSFVGNVLNAPSAGSPTVITYGAKCDGITDDTLAFQSAAAAVPSIGGSIVIPTGVNCIVGGWVPLKS